MKSSLLTKTIAFFGFPGLRSAGIITLILAVQLSVVSQTTFYIDPTYSGSPQIGTIANPYSSWTQFTITNGNTYLQKRGTTFTTSGNLWVNQKSNVTMGAYGTGSKPKFISTGNNVKVLDFAYSTNIILRNFEVTSTGDALTAIYIASGCSNVLIDSCVINNCEWGIRVVTYEGGIRILNSTIHNIGDDGIYVMYVTDIEIGYCHIYDVNMKWYTDPNQSYSPGDNIQISSTNNLYFHIHNNILDHSSTGNKFCFIAYGVNYSGLIEHNTMIGNAANVTSCLYFHPTTGTVTVRYNTLKDGNYAIYSYVNNLQLHYNKILNNRYGIRVLTNFNLTALNNVFYGNTEYCISSLGNTTITSRNNAFYLSGSSARAYSTGGSVVSNHNNFNTQQSNFINGHSTLASWRSASGNDANSYVANPQFVNPAADDYCLQPTSPNINVGAAVGLSNDFFGTAVPQASSPDIGIHEVISGGSSNLPPSISNQTFSIAENRVNGTVVGQVIASDPDAGQTITYSITSGNTSNAFAINAASGVVSVSNQQALNFETNPQFQLTVRVQDNGAGNLTASATITINLSDVNEAPVMSNRSLQLNENSPVGTIVGTMIAIDPDQGQTISFAITAGNNSGAFSINSATGVIQVSNSAVIDFELYQSFTLTIVATDNGTPSLSATASAIISIIDLNESPVINDQDFEVESGAPTGQIIGEVEASDPDAGQILTYSILSGNTSSAFQINPSSGVLSVANSSAVNYLINPQFNLVVRVADNGNPSLNSSANVQVFVSAQINNPPVIAAQTFQIAENSANGTLAGQVVASDPDQGQTLSYSITGGNSNGAFALNAATGQITVANQNVIDYETTPQFLITVQVQDNGEVNLTASAVMTINLIDVNEAPVMSNRSLQLNENSPVGTIVGTMIAIDPDQGQTISFAITAGNHSGAFSINSTTGVIQVSNSAVIDFELYQSFTLTIVATDNGTPSLSATASAIISIIDLNESPVINDQDFEVVSGSQSGYIIGEVEASDPDAGQILTYSILSGNTSSAFQINPSSGVLSVANSSAVNYLINPQFNLVVRVTDNGNPSLNSSANVQVSVSAQINNPPVIAAQTFQIAENSANGTLAGQVVASDPDQGQTLSYSITGGNSNGAFALNAATGQIAVANQNVIDYETTPQFLITVQVQDNGEVNLTASAVMTINLIDVNESPEISDQNFQAENYATNGTIAGIVIASDPDQGQSLTFAIVSGNTSGAFAVNSATGVLSVANSAAINYLINPEFDLVVSVTDNGIPSLSSSANVYVFILPSNNAPLINPQSFQVAENSANGTLVGQVVASDPDPGQEITYSIISGNSESAFMINESGQLLVNNGLAINYELQSTYQLTVMVTDNGEPSLSASARVTVSISDINEVPVIAPDQALTISEHVASGTQVGIVMASDPDFNQTLTYSITGGNNLNAFSIHPATGMISIAGFVCFEYCSSYELSIRVTDNGSPILSDEKQISIIITDINETPEIADQLFDVDEFALAGTIVGTVVATDPDLNQTLVYSIEGGNTQDAFAISSNSGEITVVNPNALNNLTNPSFSLTVMVQDNGTPTLSAYATITIATLSALSGNNAPVIEAQSFLVVEGSPSGYVIGQITASDPDQGQQLTFTIVDGNSSGAFALSQSGTISVNDPLVLVYNQNPSFTLTVSVSDNGLPVMSAEAQITIQVVPSNYPPVMLPQTFYKKENEANGSYVGKVIALDPDAAPWSLSFSIIAGNTDNAFRMQANTGRLFVNNSNALNFENIPEFQLLVQVTDSYGAYAQAIITISIIDVNEAPVVVNQIFSVNRPASSNTHVGTVIATDPDFGQILRYFIQQGNTSNIFNIDMMTGLIRINNASAFNKSRATSYNLLIRVRDDGSPALSSYAMITINVVKSKDSDEITIEQSEPNMLTEVVAYPNPSSNGIFTIKCGEFNSSDVVMTASSLTGKTIVQQQVFSSSQTILDLSAMPNGIYIIRILDGENSYMKKLIKQ